MTWSPAIPSAPPRDVRLRSPLALDARSVSLVVPVRDDAVRLGRLLGSIARLGEDARLLREVIVVDNLSRVPVRAPHPPAPGLPVRVLRCPRPGPAAARNDGARHAGAPWLLFLDSDCELTSSTLGGYAAALDGSVGYAGAVRATGDDVLSRYYVPQRILEPPPDPTGRPAYLVTATALVWREAFEAAGGFDETFPLAAGEDIDLALRLLRWGKLGFAPCSRVLHDFDAALGPFLKRFFRYGRGNRNTQVTPRAGLPDAPLRARPRSLEVPPVRPSPVPLDGARLALLGSLTTNAGLVSPARPRPPNGVFPRTIVVLMG